MSSLDIPGPGHHVKPMEDFDFDAPAEMFAAAWRFSKSRTMTYRRFDTAAAAIKFVVETMEPARINGVVIEANGVRIGADDIRRAYDSEAFPLKH